MKEESFISTRSEVYELGRLDFSSDSFLVVGVVEKTL